MDTFEYRTFELNESRDLASFSYRLIHKDKTYDFTEELQFPSPLIESPVIDRLLMSLHIALGISYYKVFVPPQFVHPYKISANEANFWNQVFIGGLGEFMYVNQIHSKDLADFRANTTEEPQLTAEGDWQEAALLGIGGGKDSIVAGELLKKVGLPTKGFVLGTGESFGQAKKVAEVMSVEVLGVGRKIDPRLLELNNEPDALNGHVPISVIFALVGTLLAANEKRKYVIVANEASSSIPNLEWEDMDINHQWSKSLIFEQAFQNYLHLYVSPDVTYFSAIRPLSTVAVCKAFKQFPKYFEVFTSDNSVFKIDPAKRPHARWSMESPKSLSSYILLTPWVDVLTLKRIFGSEYLVEQDLRLLFLELCGIEGHRPLDCVGTIDEIVLSLNLLYGKNYSNETYLMQVAKESGVIQNKDWDAELAKALTLSEQHVLPDSLKDKLMFQLQEMIN